MKRPDGGQLRKYSWDEPKEPFSLELLDSLPVAERFRAAAARAAKLDADARRSDGELSSDESTDTLLRLAACWEYVGRLRQACEVRAELLDRARAGESVGEDVVRAESAIEFARLLLRCGRGLDAAEILGEELGWAQAHSWQWATAELLVRLAAVELASGELSAPLDRIDTAFRMARELRLTATKGHALSVVGVAYILCEEHDVALNILNRAALLHQRVVDQVALAKVYTNIGVAFDASGVLVDAIPFLEAGLDFWSNSIDIVSLIAGLSNVTRAFEMHYFQPASHFRERIDELLKELPEDIGRLQDETMLITGKAVTERGAKFKGDPVIVEPVLFLCMSVIPPGLSGAYVVADPRPVGGVDGRSPKSGDSGAVSAQSSS